MAEIIWIKIFLAFGEQQYTACYGRVMLSSEPARISCEMPQTNRVPVLGGDAEGHGIPRRPIAFLSGTHVHRGDH
jgi:hypothetical protein